MGERGVGKTRLDLLLFHVFFVWNLRNTQSTLICSIDLMNGIGGICLFSPPSSSSNGKNQLTDIYVYETKSLMERCWVLGNQ